MKLDEAKAISIGETMKTRTVDSITNNEDHVRLRIFDGDLMVDEAAAELIRIARAQADTELARSREWQSRAWEAERKLAALRRHS